MTRIFRREIQRTLLWVSGNQLSLLHVRGFHALRHPFPGDFCSQQEIVTRPEPHISLYSRIGIRFVLFCFRSTLITESLLLSFPAGTKMLQFPAFPLLWSSSGIHGSKVACTSPWLIAACHALLQLPSLVIH